MHLKPTAWCEIPTQELSRLWHIFYGIFIENPLYNLFSNIKVGVWHPAGDLRCIFPPGHLSQNWLKCLDGIMHHKPTARCQISILIFEKKLWRGFSINIPWKIYQGWQSSCRLLAKLKIVSKNFSVLDIFVLWDIYRTPPLHNFFSNIKVDIWHPAVGLRCIIYIKDGKVLADFWQS
jgi:hypothetical protein